MVKRAAPAEADSGDFLSTLEKGVRTVLGNQKAEASEIVAAVNAGAKLLMIKHKISGGDEKGFFDA
jgi:hypothetical protein